MSQHDDALSMQQMLEHGEEAISMLKERTRQDLETDRQLSLALVRLMEIVGEAATRVSVATREGYPQIPWQGIIGLRNRLIHGYDEVDLDILWTIANEDVPPLLVELKRALDSID